MNVWLPLVALTTGIVCMVGAEKRWRWLIDPPAWMFFFYSQALLKLLFGVEGCRRITSFMGFLFILFSVVFLAAQGFGIVSTAGPL